MTVRDEILQRLQAAVAEVLGPEAPVLTEDMTIGDETVDSLDLVETMMIIEDVEGFTVDGEALTEITDIRGVIDVIIEARARHGAPTSD